MVHCDPELCRQIDFFYNFKNDNQPQMKLGIHIFLMYLASLCKDLAHSDFNCEFNGTPNTIGNAIAGQR